MGPDGSKRNPGDHIKLKISDHPVLRNMLDDPSDEIVFEQATNFVAGGTASERLPCFPRADGI